MAAMSERNDDDLFNVTADASDDVNFSVNLRLPKFTNDCNETDFFEALKLKINVDDIKYLGKLKYSNEWQVTLRTREARDTLLETGKLSIKNKKCVVLPCGNQVVGRIHWLPVDVSDDIVKDILQHFGEVSKFGCEKIFPIPNSPNSLIRFFILNLSNECTSDDIPHFISINKHQGLVVVKGRDPMCLQCREVGHRKAKCPVIEQQRAEKQAKNEKRFPKNRGKDLHKKKSSNECTSSNSPKNSISDNNDAVVACPSIFADNSCLGAQGSKENIHKVANEVKRLQGLMNVFSQKMNEVLTDVGSTLHLNKNNLQETESTELAAGCSTVHDTTKSKKKKKKKTKASDNYDLVPAEVISHDISSSGQHSPKGSLDSGIALNGDSKSTSEDHTDNNGNNWTKNISRDKANSSEMSTSINPDNTTVSNQRKKKKKKKSAASTIPGLTNP